MYACAYGAVLVRRSFAVVLQNTPKHEANQNEHPCFRKPSLSSPLQIALHNPTPPCRSWGIWRDPEDVPAYCIDGNVYAPTWQYGNLKEDVCADTYDTSCQEQWCTEDTATVSSMSATNQTLSGEGTTIVAGAALLLCGAGLWGKRRMKTRPPAVGGTSDRIDEVETPAKNSEVELGANIV